MKLSILHISDLHRDPENPIGNKALLDSLENDRRHYSSEETPRVQVPDIVIVSGDIIQGVNSKDPDAEKKLRAQYAESLDFLNNLTNRFVSGDKSRVMIIPGNHDVSAYHFINSLSRIDLAPGRKKQLVTQLFSPNSTLRWSWLDFELYEVVKPDIYADRLAAFADFYTAFYEGRRTYSLEPEKQFDIFDFEDFNLTIASFCSCHNNDIFNKQGCIHPDCVAAAGIALREAQYDGRLRIAVWHHNTEGLPIQSDYMDPDILQNLIDRGISLGFHGHQHRPQFLDTRFRHEGNRRITVISAGTLCGDASFGFRRAYNVVELDTEMRKGFLHVREMQNDNLLLPIWGRRSLVPNTRSYLEFEYDGPPEPMLRVDAYTSDLVEAQDLYDKAEYRKAADALTRVVQFDDLARRLLLACFVQLRDCLSIISNFDPPQSSAEAIHLMDALWTENRHAQLRQALEQPIIAATTDPSVIEMRNKYAARLRQ